ncbi:ASB3 [Cordylochernes scorpioides]|uniref:Alpha-latrotoxin n=1 Tax=Cordylochernes scorpioides TaxID=51811 RepID=A0ABY6K8G8_9ARAC|nr:ASB3 [Cordylochernes scorpioides]
MDFREVWPDTCSTVGQAARLGNLVMMKQLISDGRPLDVADNRGWRPLHEAAASLDSLKCLRELLRHRNLDLNWRTHEGESALMLAVRRQPAEMAYRAVKMLLRHGANPDLADSEEETPLLAALRSRHQAAAEVLIACCDVNKRDCGGWSPLHEAVYAGMEAVVSSGFLWLHEAVYAGMEAVVSSGFLWLHEAVYAGMEAVVSSGFLWLHEAVYAGMEAVVSSGFLWLHEAVYAGMEAVVSSGFLWLHEAVYAGMEAVVSSGFLWLHEAVYAGMEAVVSSGFLWLHEAVYAGMEAVVSSGFLWLHEAVYAGMEAVVSSGFLWLHEAVYAGMEAVVTQLLAAGACLSFRDECGLSPLFTAAQHGQLACLRMLVEAAKTQGGSTSVTWDQQLCQINRCESTIMN